MKGWTKIAVLSLFVTVLIACQFTGEANAVCSTPVSPTLTVSKTSGTTAAQIGVPAPAGCTFYVVSISGSLYNSSATAQSVLLGPSSTNTCTTLQNTLDTFPLSTTASKNTDSVFHNFAVGGQGVAMPSGDGPYMCLQFNGAGSVNDQEYLTIEWYAQ